MAITHNAVTISNTEWSSEFKFNKINQILLLVSVKIFQPRGWCQTNLLLSDH